MQFFKLFIIGVCVLGSGSVAGASSNGSIESRAVIELEVISAVDKTVGFLFPGPEFSSMGSSSIYRIQLGPDGTSIFELPVDRPMVVEMEYSGKRFPLFLLPDSEMRLTFEAAAFPESMRFAGAGGNENNWLVELLEKDPLLDRTSWEEGYWPIEIESWAFEKSRELPPDTYMMLTEERWNLRQISLSAKAIELHPVFVRYWETEFEYRFHTQQLMWFLNHLGLLAQADIRQLKRTFKPGRAADLEFDALERPVYQHFLKAWLLYQYAPNQSTVNGLIGGELFQLAEDEFQDRSKDYVLAALLIRYYNRTADATYAQKHFEPFRAAATHQPYVDAVIKSYGSGLAVRDNSYAPEFEFFTPDGDMKRLADFRGQVVYVSFWASWCKPCFKNFDNTKALRQQLEDMGVVLLNVSIDESEPDFHKALEKHDISGMNVLAYKLDDVKLNYQLSSIPAYYIVNKEGRLAYLSDSENRNILKEFRELVDK
ncbi:MAG: TlpA family protein disulfide reductase [Bacteroidetes bacterium]|nr:TlpA family protein disulfide reductase [Bacteroidota bacterium]